MSVPEAKIIQQTESPGTGIFRRFTENDLSSIARIYNYYVKNSSATYHIGELNQDRVRANFKLADASSPAFVLDVDGNVAGFALLRPYNEKEGYRFTAEVTIYLSPEVSGRGWGRKALVLLEDEARRAGYVTLIAGICTENTASLALFSKAGYVEAGRLVRVGNKFGRWLDTVYLQKIFEGV